MPGSVQLRRAYWRQKTPSLSSTSIMADVRRMECAHTPPPTGRALRDLWLRRSRSISPAAADSRAHAPLSPVTNEAKSERFLSFPAEDRYFKRSLLRPRGDGNNKCAQLHPAAAEARAISPQTFAADKKRHFFSSALGVCLVCSFLRRAPALRCLSNVFLD